MTETLNQYPEYIKQELYVLNNMLSGKFGVISNLDKIEFLFLPETIDIYKKNIENKNDTRGMVFSCCSNRSRCFC